MLGSISKRLTRVTNRVESRFAKISINLCLPRDSYLARPRSVYCSSDTSTMFTSGLLTNSVVKPTDTVWLSGVGALATDSPVTTDSAFLNSIIPQTSTAASLSSTGPTQSKTSSSPTHSATSGALRFTASFFIFLLAACLAIITGFISC